ncbi:MAG: NADH-quinone oxidoreductase subunit NuoE [Deltaproteobacteria bacterium]|nr:NADH-quinone oxidoreductase subunit NuoE [Deltaproteobacteria bacterium]
MSVLSEKTVKKIAEVQKKYPTKRSAVLPSLYLAQEEEGHVTKEAMAEIARLLKLPPVQVYESATFYTMYNKKPVGRNHIQVCTNLSCSLLGAEHIVEYISKKIGVKAGGTTNDKRFTLKTVECLGSCGTAPMMQINDDYYENLTEEKIDKILDSLD